MDQSYDARTGSTQGMIADSWRLFGHIQLSAATQGQCQARMFCFFAILMLELRPAPIHVIATALDDGSVNSSLSISASYMA